MAIISSIAKSTNSTTTGYSKLLDPHGVSLLLTSLFNNGHPNRLPSSIFTADEDASNNDGHFPDKRLIVKFRDDEGGSSMSISVPDSLFEDKSIVSNVCVCIETGISPKVVFSNIRSKIYHIFS